MPREEFLTLPTTNGKITGSDSEKLHGFDFNRKPKYFVDESLGAGTTALLRKWGCNVRDVHDVGIAGQPDENVFQYAQRNRRIVLTHDDDFINNAIFPLKGCHGIAIFPFGDGGESGFLKALAHFISGTSGAGFMFQTKIKIGEDSTWTVIALGEDGKVTKARYDLSDRNQFLKLHRTYTPPQYLACLPPRNGVTIKGIISTCTTVTGANPRIARRKQEESTSDPLPTPRLAPNAAHGPIPSLIA